MNEIGLNSQIGDVRYLFVEHLEPLQVPAWRVGPYGRSEQHMLWVSGHGSGRTETH